jgi:hypothetical protein
MQKWQMVVKSADVALKEPGKGVAGWKDEILGQDC